jgi:hypothetical protein
MAPLSPHKRKIYGGTPNGEFAEILLEIATLGTSRIHKRCCRT